MEEEKIEYLEKRIKNSRRIFEEVGTHTFLDEEIMTIIEELIEGYKTYRGQLNGAFDRGFIPISVIQNKIKQHREIKETLGDEYTHKEYKDENKRTRDFYMLVAEDLIIQAFEELLEERNK